MMKGKPSVQCREIKMGNTHHHRDMQNLCKTTKCRRMLMHNGGHPKGRRGSFLWIELQKVQLVDMVFQNSVFKGGVLEFYIFIIWSRSDV